MTEITKDGESIANNMPQSLQYYKCPCCGALLQYSNINGRCKKCEMRGYRDLKLYNKMTKIRLKNEMALKLKKEMASKNAIL